jgi:hypothetical protein
MRLVMPGVVAGGCLAVAEGARLRALNAIT